MLKVIPFLFLPLYLALGDWPQYHGPFWDKSTGPTSVNGNQLNSSTRVIWKSPTPLGFSSFSIQDNLAFTLVAEEDEDGWMNHSLKFVKHWEDSVRTDDYVTIDPLHNSKNVMSSSKTKKRRRRRSGDRDHRKDGSSEHIPMHLRGR